MADLAAVTKQFGTEGEVAPRHEISEARRTAFARTGCSKGGEFDMTFSEWLEYARANWRKEDGQTMAEYGVVLAVITVGIIAALTALSGGINGALGKVTGYL